MNLPKFKCNKIVGAFEVGVIEGCRISALNNPECYTDVDSEFFRRNQRMNEPGYIVEYEGGYISWSPKDVFESGYSPVDTAKERVKLELKELTEKLDSLEEFVSSDALSNLSSSQADMLIEQVAVMSRYAELLKLRLRTWS